MISQDEFRKVVGNFATGVTVVTTRDEKGPKGFTANAVTSLSLDPPSILVCVDKSCDTYPMLQEEGAAFVINILSEEQEALSRRFASKGENKFDGVGYYEASTGAPIIADVLAFIECRAVNRFPGGDHDIVVGEIHNLGSQIRSKPLLFYRGGYGVLQA